MFLKHPFENYSKVIEMADKTILYFLQKYLRIFIIPTTYIIWQKHFFNKILTSTIAYNGTVDQKNNSSTLFVLYFPNGNSKMFSRIVVLHSFTLLLNVLLLLLLLLVLLLMMLPLKLMTLISAFFYFFFFRYVFLAMGVIVATNNQKGDELS